MGILDLPPSLAVPEMYRLATHTSGADAYVRKLAQWACLAFLISSP